MKAPYDLRSLERRLRREVDVLRLAASGLTNEQIAHRLGVSMETVKTHLSRTFVKLEANDRAHAVAIAIREGESVMPFGQSLRLRTETINRDFTLVSWQLHPVPRAASSSHGPGRANR